MHPQTKTIHRSIVALLLGLMCLMHVGCGEKSRDEQTDEYLDDVIESWAKVLPEMQAYEDRKDKKSAPGKDAYRKLKRQLEDLEKTIDELETENVYPEAVGLGVAVAEWAEKYREAISFDHESLDDSISKDKQVAVIADAVIFRLSHMSDMKKQLNKSGTSLEEKYGYKHELLDEVLEKIND
jgi:vacuolar-type H+-ATPase subunit I/STV1